VKLFLANLGSQNITVFTYLDVLNFGFGDFLRFPMAVISQN